MANEKHLERLRQGVDAWNAWREEEPSIRPDLNEANLEGANLRGANLSEADLSLANLTGADLHGANLSKADLSHAWLIRASLPWADLPGANLERAVLNGAHLMDADLTGADLPGADLCRAVLAKADLTGADLTGADLTSADLSFADLTCASLREADLRSATMVKTILTNADLTGCHVFGISAWQLKLNEKTKQQSLVITEKGEPEVTTDNIEVAQFLYLMLHNEKIRSIIDTIGKKGVLLLGRFSGGRLAILKRLRDELRKRDFVPMVFNFDKPTTKDFTETVRVLASLSRFVIVDITNPRSAPLELQATVPEYMIPFVPILEHGEEPFSMFRDLWIKHREWVLDPIRYPSADRLIEVLDTEIINPAQERFAKLLMRKAEEVRVRDV